MEYPGSRLTKTWRKIILWLFIASFLVSAPLIVLYASGYRWSPDFSNFSKVGTLSISGEPRNAQIYLNNRLAASRLPADFKALPPGTYRITIHASQHHSWESTLSVRGKESSYIHQIDLPKKSVPEQILSTPPRIWLASERMAGIFYTTPHPRGTAILFRPLINPLFRTITTTTDTIISMYLSPRENILALTGVSSTVFIDTDSLSVITSTPLTDVRWDSAEPDTLVYGRHHQTIVHLNLKEQSVIGAVSSTETTWFPFKKSLWTIASNTAFSDRLTITSTAFLPTLFNKNIASFNALLERWYPGMGIWHIADISDTRVLLKNTHEPRSVLITPWAVSETRTSDYSIEPAKRYTLLFGPFEIWHVNETGEKSLSYRSGERLTGAAYLNDTGLIALATEETIQAYQTNYGTLFPLLTSSTIHRLSTLSALRYILFEGTYRGSPGLWSLTY